MFVHLLIKLHYHKFCSFYLGLKHKFCGPLGKKEPARCLTMICTLYNVGLFASQEDIALHLTILVFNLLQLVTNFLVLSHPFSLLSRSLHFSPSVMQVAIFSTYFIAVINPQPTTSKLSTILSALYFYNFAMVLVQFLVKKLAS